jgi:hypothetical protein
MNELNSEIFPNQDIDSTSTNIDFLSDSGFPGAEAFLGLNFSNTPSTGASQIRNTSGTTIGLYELPFSPAEELDLSVSAMLFSNGTYELTILI